jgi:hypothetical protein
MLRRQFSHLGAAVERDIVPDDDDLAANGAEKPPKKIACLVRPDVLPGVQSEEQFWLARPGTDTNPGDGGHFVIRAHGLLHNRCLATRCPGPAHAGMAVISAFINEYYGCTRFLGFFLILGQSRFAQRSIASSSRSVARRVGRCTLHPSCFKIVGK